MDEINKVNDVLEFKLSIKSIIIISFICGVVFLIFFILISGGITNAILYIKNMFNYVLNTNINVNNKHIKRNVEIGDG
jgi:hypothetical protein